jgi:hypothetical protein
MFGLRMGLPTINIGGALQQTEFDRAIPLDLDIETALGDPAGLYARQRVAYDKLARAGERHFPRQAFHLWAAFEGLEPVPRRAEAAQDIVPAAVPAEPK